MQILQTIIVTFFFLSSVVLILLVLLQSGKSGGMGIMGGGSSNTAFGSSTVDVVEKITWWGILAFFILAILSAMAFADAGPDLPVPGGALEENIEIPLETQGDLNGATESQSAPVDATTPE